MPVVTHSPFRFALPLDHEQSRKPRTSFWIRRNIKNGSIRSDDNQNACSSLSKRQRPNAARKSNPHGRRDEKDEEWRTGDAFDIPRPKKARSQISSGTRRFGHRVDDGHNTTRLSTPAQSTVELQDTEISRLNGDEDMLELEEESNSLPSILPLELEIDAEKYDFARKRRRLDPASGAEDPTTNAGEKTVVDDFVTPNSSKVRPQATISPTPSRAAHTFESNYMPVKYTFPTSTFSPAPSTASQFNRVPHFSLTPSRQSPTVTPAPPQFSRFLAHNASGPFSGTKTTQTLSPAHTARATQFILPAASTSDPAGQSRATVPPESTYQTRGSSLLPSAFSPHNRKSQTRFIPDGWASQVRLWIVDASSVPHGPGAPGAVTDMPRALGTEEMKTAVKGADGSVRAVVVDFLGNSEDAIGQKETFSTYHATGLGEENTFPVLLRARLLYNRDIEPLQQNETEGDIHILLTGQEKKRHPFMGRLHAQGRGNILANIEQQSQAFHRGREIGLGPPWWSLDLHTGDNGTVKTWLVCAGGWWLP